MAVVPTAEHNGRVALSTGTLLKRGFRKRCPVCGDRRIFRRWFRMPERCPRCHLRFAREPGQWLGSWFLNVCLAQILAVLVVLAAVVPAYPEPPTFGVIVAGGFAVVAFPFWFFPFSRSIWLAIDLAMRPLEFGEGVDPMWELDADLARLLADESRPAEGETPAN